VANLLPISALFLCGCIAALLYLSSWARRHGTAKAKEEKALGGGILDGLKLVLQKPLLLWMCALLLLMAIAGTLMYFEQQRLVAKAFSSSTERTQYFAQLDLVTNAVVLLVEIFFTSQVMKRFGLLPALLALPVLTVVGFIWLAVNPALFVIATLLVLRRAAEYALAKPAREVLFTVLSKEEKYKAKNVIDTVVHRAGDATGAWLSTALKTLAPSTGEVAAMLTPVGLVSCGVAWYLARAHELKQRDASAP
jgi:AAA family ATP:ADP antiporter